MKTKLLNLSRIIYTYSVKTKWVSIATYSVQIVFNVHTVTR